MRNFAIERAAGQQKEKERRWYQRWIEKGGRRGVVAADDAPKLLNLFGRGGAEGRGLKGRALLSSRAPSSLFSSCLVNLSGKSVKSRRQNRAGRPPARPQPVTASFLASKLVSSAISQWYINLKPQPQVVYFAIQPLYLWRHDESVIRGHQFPTLFLLSLQNTYAVLYMMELRVYAPRVVE